ncbi:branched chain amino acid ABC transporter inner membrane protein [Caballeronia calidae]|uniref:Branched chain amino acid ABC transporter inner membrane protein n=1 Tax=Caballeronia calidae TaxID=1777139 RepID=A0A158E505_9BURK|nr:branched-chain amino acid ABC transporter permease [Caballeronia calidae]SAL01810.1 branched chain amino acid ABC transporter inner membrane protein [Caballeronia calidae]
MQTALQLLITTLQIGAVYILFSLGLTLIFGVMRIVNFVHGHFFALAALMIPVLVPKMEAFGCGVFVAFLLSAVVGVVASLALAAIVFRFGVSKFLRDMEGAFILTMGMALLLDGTFLASFGGNVHAVPQIIEGNVKIFSAVITTQRLMLCLASAVMTGILFTVLRSTKLGLALRAVASDREAALLQGIPYGRIALIGFLLAALMAAVAGVLIAPVTIVTPFIGSDYLMKTFVAVVVGGLGSIPGAIVGSILIAFIEAVGGFYFDASTATIAMFLIVIVVLLFRPRGLLAHA